MGRGRPELIRTTARVEFGTAGHATGQLRYLTRVDGSLVSGRYPFVMDAAETFEVASVEFLDAGPHPAARAAAGRPAAGDVRLLLALDLLLLPGRRGAARLASMAPSSTGSWRPLDPAVWETVVTPCDCCGQVVAKRLWVVEIDGRGARFCWPECEELYRDYVVPRRERTV